MPTERSPAQNRKFSALVSDIARRYPLIPYRRSFANEAWRRYLIACFVREARWEAFNAGAQDPFPIRPVPSSSLDSRQMAELIEATQTWCAQNDIEASK